MAACFGLPMDYIDRLQSKKDDKDQKTNNQVPHLAQDTTWESNKNTINITNKSQEVKAC